MNARAKICGLTRVEDARLALDLGAWALGFVFYDQSPRAVTPEHVHAILQQLPAGTRAVGVFVNPTREGVEECVRSAGLTHIQLSGNESPEFCAGFSKPVWKVFHLKSPADLGLIPAYKVCEAHLIDAAVEGSWGGTGQLADWSLAQKAKKHGHCILSGGLNPENVAEAFRIVQPWAVDVSSGLEMGRPGVKDETKLRAFFSVLERQR